ncbi:MAG: hypothetical protein JWO86_8890 [Myxococcaceae bacterium]|nr:hypothetical protein [Myxococcaceae bacterium]
MRFSTFGAIAVGLVLVSAGCSSNTPADGCAPTSSITASGALVITRGAASTVYVLSKQQGIDLFNEGLLTVMAGDSDSGAGTLDPKDPVVLVKMDPSTDTPGTYGLDAVHAQVAYCPSASAKLVVTNGALTGCAPSGTPMTEALSGSLTVTSASSKKIDPVVSAHTLSAEYGTQTQQCN